MICWLIIFIVGWVHTSTWSASASSNTATTTVQNSFSNAHSIYTYEVKSGPVSSGLYYLYYLFKSNPVYTSVVRKENSDGTQAWMTALLLKPNQKGLSVDALEQNVYFASLTTPSLNVVRLHASNGSIVSTQVQYDFIYSSYYTNKNLLKHKMNLYIKKQPYLKFRIFWD